jgi:hypothetical protein
MNINMLFDTDDDPGFYAAAASTATGWRGATLSRSNDGGSTWQFAGTFTELSTVGTCLTALGNYQGGNTPDELNSVTVQMTCGTLGSVSYAAFLGNTQLAIIGDEIVSFRSATLNIDGTYTVRGFLRGRRGSEYAISLHAIGDRFVLVDTSIMIRVADTSASIGLPRLYRAVSSGLSTATPQTFTNTGAGLKPYSVVQVAGGRYADGSVLITWVRRGRTSGEWRDGVEVPVGETSETYELVIWNAARTTQLRTLSGISSPSVVYSAAQQISDFGSLQGAVAVSVFQMSSVVGRGYEARASV